MGDLRTSIKRKIKKALAEAVSDAVSPAFAPGHKNPPINDENVVIEGDYWNWYESVGSNRAKQGYSQSAPTGMGVIPRGSELDMNLQRMLDREGHMSNGFMGQPAPPDDSHPVIDYETYYRRVDRTGRKYFGQPPNAALIYGESNADDFVTTIKGSLKTMLKSTAIQVLRSKSRAFERGRR